MSRSYLRSELDKGFASGKLVAEPVCIRFSDQEETGLYAKGGLLVPLRKTKK